VSALRQENGAFQTELANLREEIAALRRSVMAGDDEEDVGKKQGHTW